MDLNLRFLLANCRSRSFKSYQYSHPRRWNFSKIEIFQKPSIHPRNFEIRKFSNFLEFLKTGFYMEWVSHYVMGRKHCCTDHSLIMRGQLICRITQLRSTSSLVKPFRHLKTTIFLKYHKYVSKVSNLLNYLFLYLKMYSEWRYEIVYKHVWIYSRA